MAQNKLTWQELRKAVAELAVCSEKDAEVFLNALISSVIDGLKKDKQVKIKGLGVFSLKAVAPRKSVNIATGEDFTIEGYNKLTFTAEAMLKESVEKRIEKPSTEEAINAIVNDPIEKLGKQADEIVDILAELGQAPESHAAEEPKKNNEAPEAAPQEVVEEVVEEPAVAVDKKKKCTCKCKWIFWVIGGVLLAGLIGAGVYFREPIIGWWQCTKIMEKPIKKSEYHDIIVERHKIPTAEVEVVEVEKPSIADRTASIYESIVGWWEGLVEEGKIMVEKMQAQKEEQAIEIVEEVEAEVVIETEILNQKKPGIEPYQPNYRIIERSEEMTEEVVEEVVEEEVEVVELVEPEEVVEEVKEEVVEAVEAVEEVVEEVKEVVKEEVKEEVNIPLADQPRVYKKFIATEVVGKGSRLTWIAKKHYGEKDLWVFIYEANRNRIGYPEYLAPGQKIRIPELDKKYRDLSNPELRQLVDSLTKEYLRR